jgi:LmbE family N-acetylglucosaminyl deacetylase
LVFKLNAARKNMEKFIPQNANPAPVKYMAIGAHQDDVEIMALDGILKGQGQDASFCAVVLADGAGCPKNGKYANLKKDEIMRLRSDEQKRAAQIGRYHSLYLLNKPSENIKRQDAQIVAELVQILKEYPALEVLYIHDLCDRHQTHVGAAKLALFAVLKLPQKDRPKKLLGCEMWRSLDWLPDDEKVVLDLDFEEDASICEAQEKSFADRLVAVYESQNSAKSYDEGARGRRLANATFSDSHQNNAASERWFAMDLTPLICQNAPSVKEFLSQKLDKFKKSVLDNFD